MRAGTRSGKIHCFTPTPHHPRAWQLEPCLAHCQQLMCIRHLASVRLCSKHFNLQILTASLQGCSYCCPYFIEETETERGETTQDHTANEWLEAGLEPRQSGSRAIFNYLPQP